MYIYAYSFKVDPSIHEQWLEWIQQEFIRQHLATELFEGFKLTRILNLDTSDGFSYSIQFTAASLSFLQRYTAQHANQVMQKHHQQFGGKYVSFQTVMEVIAS